MSLSLDFLLALTKDINANKGTTNCVHCALRFDDHVAQGENLSLGPVPKKRANLKTYPIFKEGEIIRSQTADIRLTEKAIPTSKDYRVVCDLDSGDQLTIDLTETPNQETEARFLKTDIENLKQILIDSARRAKDGSSYGFILLTHSTDARKGHLINFFVDKQDNVFFIDAQRSKPDEQVQQELNMAFYRSEIFYLHSIPPEGFFVKEEIELEIKQESDSDLIISTETDTEVKRFMFKETLHQKGLLEGVVLDGKNVKLTLKEEYNQKARYLSINCGFNFLYKKSAIFQDKFEKPKTGGSKPCLTLKEGHGYRDEKEVLEAILSFAAPKEKLNLREALIKGKLIKKVELEDKKVTLILNDAYHHPTLYLPINVALVGIYQLSTAFQAKFEPPSQTTSVPTLMLKEGHGYVNAQAVLEALNHLIQPQEKLPYKKAFVEGKVLKGITLSDNKASLVLYEEFDQQIHYFAINRLLYTLYKTSDPFQEKFEQPKTGKPTPCLTLKEDHGYHSEEEVFAALMSFAAPKEKIDVIADLRQGKLLEFVAWADNEVRLLLKNGYHQPGRYLSVNHGLLNLYHISELFQEKFEQPKIGTFEPCLKLKENHGYRDEQEILTAIISFAALKEKFNVKQDLAQGKVLEQVTLLEHEVSLILKSEYNDSTRYQSINGALYALYRTCVEFQEKFEKPKTGNSKPCLILKKDHGYRDEKEVLAAIISFAAPKRNLNIKEALELGKLLEHATLIGQEVKLALQDEYNQPTNYIHINRALYELYHSSTKFQEKFEPPKVLNSEPSLTLKPGHGYRDGQEVLDALVSFAKDKERYNVREDLAQGELFESVQVVENEVKLILKNKYNHPAHYHPINTALFTLYQATDAFRENFEQPKKGKSEPCLTLTKEHGYRDEQEIFEALISFAEPKAKVKSFNIKGALANGKLIESVELVGHTVKLLLKKTYNDPTHYFVINYALKSLYVSSPEFQAKFEQPVASRNLEPSLTLKEGHGYEDERAVLQALKNFSEPKSKLLIKIREPLGKGKLLERVAVNGNKVTLFLKDKYNDHGLYKHIKRAFYTLYEDKPEFQEKFEWPTAFDDEDLSLTLKQTHGFHDEKEVLAALIRFAAPREEKINVREALRKGELIERLEFVGNEITLILKEKYNNAANFISIRQSLYQLYNTSEIFQEKFKIPSKGKSVPSLTLKENHGFHNADEILKALIQFAVPKERARSKPLSIKKALKQGELIEKVELADNNKVKIILKSPFDQSKNYGAINSSLKSLYLSTPQFKEKFDEPTRSRSTPPYLTLKEGHGYRDGDEVLASLLSFASPKEKKLNIKENLLQGKLLEGFDLADGKVTFRLKDEYNQSIHFLPINQFLYKQHKSSKAFQALFEQPKNGKGVPYLILKDKHAFSSGKEVLESLMSVVRKVPEEGQPILNQFSNLKRKSAYPKDESERSSAKKRIRA